MKKLPVLGALILLFISFLYAATAQSHNNSAPNMECINCHEGDMQADMVSVQGIPKNYKPGKVYTMSVVVKSKLESLGDIKGGFALETDKGTLVVKDKKNTQLIDGFLTHTQEGSHHRKWTFSWKAPEDKSDASISVMAVASNGDYSSQGDLVGAASYTIKSGK
ncbi:MAG: hypothetical protein EPN22_05320 [Nitrospirae bacterium]|nr:MAG: hypothetical protein EPN22_05320 [Nitrospirota bacterium]